MTNYNLFPISAPSGLQANEPDVTVNVGTSFFVTGPAWLTEIRYLQPSGGGTRWGTRWGALWEVNAPAANVCVIGNREMPAPVSENSWVTYVLPDPYPLVVNQHYRVAVLYPQGGYPATGHYFDGAGGTVQGVLTVPNGVDAGYEQGTYKYTPYWADMPDSAYNNGAYYADATITDVNPYSTAILPSGIASGEAFGTAAVAGGALVVTPSGLASGEAFGTAAAAAGTLAVSPSGIASAEAFGTATVTTPGAAFTVSPAGIGPAEAFGTATATSTLTVSPTGITTAAAFGAASVSPTPPAINIVPGGMGSMQAWGTPAIMVKTEIAPAGLASAQAFGQLTVVPGAITAYPQGIDSAATFGTPELTVGALPVGPAGVVSAEAFGTAVLSGAVAGNFEFHATVLPRRFKASIVPNQIQEGFSG